ncbi:MAG: GNAT family N-acetyltransferase [Betaproteobacteria bacterium]|nr:MAG: GNAT family N-acetyltransferase [Betaproteobacteria bacterium]
MTDIIDKFRSKLERHGALNTVQAQTLKGLDSLCGLKILRGVYVVHPDESFLKCPANYSAGFLTASELREYARLPETEISSRFLDEALARGDECYAIRDGNVLAAYGWYSFGQTPVGMPGLLLGFSQDYVYMYKGFTDTRYRGQRLHAIGMTRALRHYTNHGCRGLVSYVEATNLSSLKSCLRMGYRVFGSVYVLRALGRHYACSSPGCRQFAFRLERPAIPSGLRSGPPAAPAR